MDDSGKLFIKDLTTKTRKGYLCVRIMRKWNYNGNVPGGPVLYIGLVLADEQGKSIYAQISQSEVERLGSALLMNGVYTIRKFTDRVCRPNYIPFDADLMIQLTFFTTITPSKVPESKFPNIIYNITSFKDIRTVGSAATKYIDVLGIITSEGLPRTINVKSTDRVSPLKEITIQDLSGMELTATLWDQHVDGFQLKHASTNEPLDTVVVLFCGCLAKKIFNKTQVNVGNASCWFINPDIQEAQPFYDRLKTHPMPIHRVPISAQPTDGAVQPKILEHKTLAEMNALDPYDFPDEGCRCTVTVTEIPAEQAWWYMGCEMCKKRLWNNGGNYFCSACKWSTAVPLYKFQFVASDSTGTAHFFCYDVVARQIIRRNCDSLLRVANNAAGLPEQILRVIGRSFTFTVALTDQSFESPDTRVYLVDSTLFRPQDVVPATAAHPSVETTVQTVHAPPSTPLALPPIRSSALPMTEADSVSSAHAAVNQTASPVTPETPGAQPSLLLPTQASQESSVPSKPNPTEEPSEPETAEKETHSGGKASHVRKKLKYAEETSVQATESDRNNNSPKPRAQPGTQEPVAHTESSCDDSNVKKPR